VGAHEARTHTVAPRTKAAPHTHTCTRTHTRACPHLQDLGAASGVWQRHVDDAVKAPGPDERGVDGAGPVGGAQHDEAAVVLKPVHLSLCVHV
jgi:hypothetical protein